MIRCWLLKWQVVRRSDPEQSLSPAGEAHIRDCTSCREWVERQREIDARLRGELDACEDNVPARLHPRIMAAVNSPDAGAGRMPRGCPVHAYALAAAAAVAVILGLVWLQPSGDLSVTSVSPDVVEVRDDLPADVDEGEDFRLQANELLTVAYRQELQNIASDLLSTSNFLATCLGEPDTVSVAVE